MTVVWCHISCCVDPSSFCCCTLGGLQYALSKDVSLHLPLGSQRHTLLSLPPNSSDGVQILIVLHFIQFGWRETSIVKPALLFRSISDSMIPVCWADFCTLLEKKGEVTLLLVLNNGATIGERVCCAVVVLHRSSAERDGSSWWRTDTEATRCRWSPEADAFRHASSSLVAQSCALISPWFWLQTTSDFVVFPHLQHSNGSFPRACYCQC